MKKLNLNNLNLSKSNMLSITEKIKVIGGGLTPCEVEAMICDDGFIFYVIPCNDEPNLCFPDHTYMP